MRRKKEEDSDEQYESGLEDEEKNMDLVGDEEDVEKEYEIKVKIKHLDNKSIYKAEKAMKSRMPKRIV